MAAIPQKLSPEFKTPAVRLFSQAFLNDPLFKYLIPDPRRRAQQIGIIFRVVVELGLRFGELWALDNELAALALLLPDTELDLPLPRLIAAGGLSYLGLGPAADRRLLNFSDFSTQQQRLFLPQKHVYLQLLAVKPELQRQGKGAALLRSIQALQQKTALPIYLETENPENLPFYTGLGFKLLGESSLPRSSVPLFSMAWQP